jgi:hypothetical protein
MDQWEQGRKKGDQSHVSEDIVRVRVCRRYVVVAFARRYVVLVRKKLRSNGGIEAGDRKEPQRIIGSIKRLPNVLVALLRSSRVRRYVVKP